jgi:hypothetical protein
MGDNQQLILGIFPNGKIRITMRWTQADLHLQLGH